MIEALHIQVRGIVQGVGFRPFIYKLAKRYLIKGWVLNSVEGVTIHAEGETKLLDEFVLEISENPPAAAQVTEIELREVPLENFTHFEIRFSDEAEVEKTTLISPDLATCPDCEKELFDPRDRRFRYTFINCTNCGPRFTIINELPYDRKKTSMKDFQMCSPCQVEYDEPLDRRFHAQPDACFDCGPRITWRVGSAEILQAATREESDAIFAEAVNYFTAGKIVAVKGLGGFHLACDAENEGAVALLRERKRRYGKAFAVMMKDIDQVKQHCFVNHTEARLLTGKQRPIVLLKKRSDVSFVPGLADGLTELGVMLPYTPVQHILLNDFKGMLVMTSGNIHDEPIVTDDEEAFRLLGGIADSFLGNNRTILSRYDDSVIRVIRVSEADYTLQFIRRARGYAPLPLELPISVQETTDRETTDPQKTLPEVIRPETTLLQLPSVFATGPEQKNTFCLTRGKEAFVSQHLGDMENAPTFDAWLETKETYERLFDIRPQIIACDMHPEYLTTKWAHEQNLSVIEVQHHHAHIVSVMAENKLEGPVCGFAFDGTGYGIDGSLWGGEVLLCNLGAFERFANFVSVPLPGGAAAIKHPARMAYGVLWNFDLLDHPAAKPVLDALGDTAHLCLQMIENGINTPFSSSVGRLFDAASALMGICLEPKYEGEGAILLEAAIDEASLDCLAINENTIDEASVNYARGSMGEVSDNAYIINLVKNTATQTSTAQDTSVILFDAAPTFAALLDDLQAAIPLSLIAKRFHDAFVNAIVQMAELVYSAYEINTFALSGGVFMNRYLIEHTIEKLTKAGFSVALNRDLPPNDGCISYGQAVVTLNSNNNKTCKQFEQ